ncbi:MAG: hypothetical protein APR54_07735 [Candidatus Cloacimonas sp. SDB]|nr:MAG: hypothetical protein APR54_07735 [Candidatus Cloacimonas sp. SDB]
MAYKKKSWQDKMADKKNTPKILILQENFPCYRSVAKMGRKVGDRCVLVNPREVREIMLTVPKGKLMTIYEICKKLAAKYNVETCCSLTMGIFIMTAANAAKEAKQQGKKDNLAYWRTLKSNGYLNPKYPGGMEKQKELLEAEDFVVEKRGKNYRVKDFEKYLVEV